MNITSINKSLYGLLGVILIAIGLVTTLYTLVPLPDAIKNIILSVARHEPNGVHLIQEWGSFMLGVGVVSFWFMRNYQYSKVFHWAMVLVFAVFALVHWFDARGPWKSLTGPVINTIPFLIFATTGFFRKD